MALPGNGTILAVDPRRDELARQAAARRSWSWCDLDLKPRDIVTADAIDNAFALDMAMGGSTNTVLHTLAIAHEAGVDYELERMNEISAAASQHLQGIALVGLPHGGRGPRRRHHGHPEGDRQAARPAAPGRPTVTGKTLGENIAGRRQPRPPGDPPPGERLQRRGGLAMLFGNLAPDGAVVKTAGVVPEMLVHRGPAVVFDSQDERLRGHPGGQGEARRRGGDPLRGAQGRPRHAGDARPHQQHHGAWAWAAAWP